MYNKLPETHIKYCLRCLKELWKAMKRAVRVIDESDLGKYILCKHL